MSNDFPFRDLDGHYAIQGDMLAVLKDIPDNFFDLVICSPPYEDARTYGSLAFSLNGQEYVDWAVERYSECVRVCKGLVIWVIEGRTRKFQWSATPVLLMADLHRAGVKLRKPPIFHRIGIPGSGGPDWWRNDYEFCIASSKGKLPWSDNTATGHPPRWGPGGEMSNRTKAGGRVNQWGNIGSKKGMGNVSHDGKVENSERPSHIVAGKNQWGHSINSGATVVDEGGVVRGKGMRPSHRLSSDNLKGSAATIPVLANPGNVIRCKVGGGVMGSDLAHKNEAPFPEALVEPFVRSFAPPGGRVLDCFGGSGTTAAVCEKWGRESWSIDVRASQIDLIERRVAEAKAKRSASESDRPSPEQPSLFPLDAATPEPAPSHPAPESD